MPSNRDQQSDRAGKFYGNTFSLNVHHNRPVFGVIAQLFQQPVNNNRGWWMYPCWDCLDRLWIVDNKISSEFTIATGLLYTTTQWLECESLSNVTVAGRWYNIQELYVYKATTEYKLEETYTQLMMQSKRLCLCRMYGDNWLSLLQSSIWSSNTSNYPPTILQSLLP